MFDNWRDIRSITDLNAFIEEFRTISKGEKDDILREMVLCIAEYKAKEQLELDLMPRQAEKSTVLRKSRRPRSRSRL